MKNKLLILVFFGSFLLVNAQSEKVKLQDEKLLAITNVSMMPIETIEYTKNENQFIRNLDLSYSIKNDLLNLEYWVDLENWSVKNKSKNPEISHELKLKGSKVRATIESYKAGLSLQDLMTYITELKTEKLQNLSIIKEEYRDVNGLLVLTNLYEAENSKGVKMAYMNYYYSSDLGYTVYSVFGPIEEFYLNIEKNENLLNGISK